MLSSSFALDSSEAESWRSKSERYAVIFSLTSCFVVPQKDLRFLAPCSSEYQTTPFQRPSVRLKMFPFVNSFRCIFQHLFLSDTTYHDARPIARGHSVYYQKSNNLAAWPEALSLFYAAQLLSCLDGKSGSGISRGLILFRGVSALPLVPIPGSPCGADAPLPTPCDPCGRGGTCCPAPAFAVRCPPDGPGDG